MYEYRKSEDIIGKVRKKTLRKSKKPIEENIEKCYIENNKKPYLK